MRIASEGIKTIKRDGILAVPELIYRFSTLQYFAGVATLRAPVNYEGVSLPTDHPSINKAAKRRIMTGIWEREEIEAVDKYFREPSNFIELGSCFGFMTAYILKKFDCSVRSFSVEANPRLASAIEQTRELNNVNFEFVPAAYHSQLDHVSFLSSPRVGSGKLKTTTESITVEATSVRELITSNDLHEPVIIADIEGSEADLISNEMDVLKANCPLLIIELHDSAEIHPNEMEKSLQNAGFEKLDKIQDVVVYDNPEIC